MVFGILFGKPKIGSFGVTQVLGVGFVAVLGALAFFHELQRDIHRHIQKHYDVRFRNIQNPIFEVVQPSQKLGARFRISELSALMPGVGIYIAVQYHYFSAIQRRADFFPYCGKEKVVTVRPSSRKRCTRSSVWVFLPLPSVPSMTISLPTIYSSLYRRGRFVRKSLHLVFFLRGLAGHGIEKDFLNPDDPAKTLAILAGPIVSDEIERRAIQPDQIVRSERGQNGLCARNQMSGKLRHLLRRKLLRLRVETGHNFGVHRLTKFITGAGLHSFARTPLHFIAILSTVWRAKVL